MKKFVDPDSKPYAKQAVDLCVHSVPMANLCYKCAQEAGIRQMPRNLRLVDLP